ncbi:PREDICTED: DNA demethylase ALKBH1-like isoform X2 [Amphimedon queenslandica]|uniref:Alpha-ketoglutarate-dependent dioxygenase AlkB-like domain-containing protein n=1 Tax=Amphimedon queenslandica TaxID=400682 RepID=A0AAN0J488_AMPQE|nr:PREDICTED: DNA demethylase ALKBH1-like isoform X2 [Amphimedon queenslandica]|eukprot:XP_019851810.1 PREDICTED: DNA demethylase ALKBH1-like isoform X2 [Amphimedon queenslandica]
MDEDVDAFKKEFKRFKRPSEDDIKDIIDFTQPERFNEILTIQTVVDPPPLGASISDVQSSCNELGLTLPSEWKVYSLKTIPGLIFITNPFLCGGQHYWIQKCLLQYPLLPNVTNLDSHISRTGSGQIWPMGDSPVSVHKDSLLYKLRWVTLGYHYNWTSKLYHKEHHSPFPSDLSLLSHFILSSVGFPDFKAEAAIVNYYHFESTLSGHTDHSEADLTSPLISLSPHKLTNTNRMLTHKPIILYTDRQSIT